MHVMIYGIKIYIIIITMSVISVLLQIDKLFYSLNW